MVAPCSQRPRGENDEGDEARNVIGGAEPGDADVLAVPFAHFGLALAGALHVSFHTTGKTLGVDIARMDAVDLHAVGLAEIGQRLGERRHRRVDGTTNGEARRRHAAAGAADADDRAAARLQEQAQAARASRTCAKNLSA